MQDFVVYASLFGFGFAFGLGAANRLYATKSQLFMSQIKSALDSTGIRRDEFLPVKFQAEQNETRIRQLEAAVSQLRRR